QSAPLFAYFLSFTRPAPASTYLLSLHDALPIFEGLVQRVQGFEIRDALRMPGPRRAIVLADDLPYLVVGQARMRAHDRGIETRADRKSTRLNSSHVKISYAVFCLKKKKTETTNA